MQSRLSPPTHRPTINIKWSLEVPKNDQNTRINKSRRFGDFWTLYIEEGSEISQNEFE